MISARYRARWAAWFFAGLAAHIGVSVAVFGEMTLDEVRRRQRS